jgi:hypothetical protein
VGGHPTTRTTAALSQSINQARHGWRKRPTRQGATPLTGRGSSPAPFSRMALMTNRPLPEPLSRLRLRWPAVALLLLRNPDGGPLCDSFVHLLGGKQRPDRHASKPSGICNAQLKRLRCAAIAFSYRHYVAAHRHPFGRFFCGRQAPKAPARMVVGNSEAVKTAWSQIERRRFQIRIRSETCW